MNALICLSVLLIARVQVPPVQNPPIPSPTNPGQNVSNGQLPPGSFGSMYQMPVDGTYQIMAYEKFGQVLPGMNTIKVVIRSNILIFPGDGKLPGKMIQLAFGPNNTIMLTPLDGRNDPIKPNPWQSPGGTPPIAARNPDPNAPQTGGVSQAGLIQPSAQSEMGVYVLSTEFFSISVTGKPPINDPVQQVPPGNTQPPGSTQPPIAPRTITPPTPVQPPNVARTITPPGSTNPPIDGKTSQPPAAATPQQPTATTTPPGAPNQAVLVLRRVAG